MREAAARPRWSLTTKLVLSALALALVLFLVIRFSIVIPPLILAAVLAFVLTPAVDRLQNRLRIRRGLAALAVYVLLIGLIALLLSLLIPPLVDQVQLINLDFQTILSQLTAAIGTVSLLGGITIDGAQLIEEAESALRTLIEPVFSQTVTLAVEVITSLVWVVFITVISFYLVKDGALFWRWVEQLPAPAYREDLRLLKAELNGIWSDFFRGQLVLALVVAIIFQVVGLIIGLPFSLAMALFAGLMEFIPSVGHGIWLFVAALLTLFQGSTWLPLPNWLVALTVIGLHLVFQQVDLNYLIPRIIGRRMHLHPLVVILGIIAGAALAGVLGVVLAAPTIASLRVLSRYLVANLSDQDPFRARRAQEGTADS